MNGQQQDRRQIDADVASLLVDTRLLQRHLAEYGKLPDVSLGEAIDAMERAPDGEETKAYAALVYRYSATIASMDSTCIEAFRHRQARRHRSDMLGAMRAVATASVAVVLILLAVVGFVIVQDVDDNVTELQRINLQNPLQKLTELRRLIGEGALKDPKSAYYLQYLKAQGEVSQMFDTANQILDRTRMSSETRNASGTGLNDDETGIVSQLYNLVLYSLSGPRPASSPALAAFGWPAGPVETSHAASGAGAAGGAGAPGASGGVEGNRYTKTDIPIVGAVNCKPYDKTPLEKLIGNGKKDFLLAALDRFDDICLAQTLDIRVGIYRMGSALHTVKVLQDQLFIVGVLFLPLIGGLLGATIATLYAILNEGAVARVSDSVMRIVAGGAFGVIIGWFSAGTANGASNLIQHVTATPFTLAVIAGFSIDSLSSVLSRFIRNMARAKPERTAAA